jgi:hypothetical protein
MTSDDWFPVRHSSFGIGYSVRYRRAMKMVSAAPMAVKK